MRLRKALNKIKRKASGYMLIYDPRGETEYACRAWFAEQGPWFHGYGTNEEEAAEDCFNQLEAWWEIRNDIGLRPPRRWKENGKETKEEADTEDERKKTE